MEPDENAVETATEVGEEEAAEVAAAMDETAAETAVAEEPETGDAPELGEALDSDGGTADGENGPADEDPEDEGDEDEGDESEPEAEFNPSMTDEVQARMNAGIAQGNEARRATIGRNKARKAQQHAAIHATNRPGPQADPADEEE